MPRVVHFEIHASEPERTVAFYRDLFGWDAQTWGGSEPYWLLTTGKEGEPGINGGLLVRHGPAPEEDAPVNAFVCTIDVPDVDASVARALASGGRLALPKMAVPGVGWLAYCKDPAGNVFGMMQADPQAK